MIQIASVSTSAATVRSEIEGWTFEDASLLIHRSSPSGKLLIGHTPSPKDIPFYTCVLEMLADSWELLGPPTRESWSNDEGQSFEQWGWWLQRKKEST